MSRHLLMLTIAIIVACSNSLVLGQRADRDAGTRAKAAASDRDVTYGQIKELVPGQKVVIHIDNAPDKTFNLSDRAPAVNLARGLKVGDAVKISEHDVAGKTQSVTITKHSGGDVAQRGRTTEADVTYGRIKELVAGQKVVIDVDNAPDKTFDLADKDLGVNLGKGLKVGDPVKVSEHDVAGKTKSVTIAKHTGGGVAHGDKDPAAKKQ